MKPARAIIPVVLVLCCARAGAVEPPSAADVAALLTEKTVEDHRAFSAAERTMAGLTDARAVPVLLEGLRHKNVKVRYLAISGLHALKAPESAQGLMDYVAAHPSGEIMAKAMIRLVSERDLTLEVFALRGAIETLGALKDKRSADVIARELGVKELNGAPEKAFLAIAGVRAAVEREPKTDYGGMALSNALTQLRDAAKMPELLIIAGDRAIAEPYRRGAVCALGWTRFAEAEGVLEKISKDLAEPRLLRSAAFVSLAQIAPAKHLPGLGDALAAQKNDLVTSSVVQGLGGVRLAEAAPFLKAMLDDPRQEVQWKAADSLAQCSGVPYEATVNPDSVEIRWPPSEKLFPEGKVLVFTGRVARDLRSDIEYRQRFRR